MSFEIHYSKSFKFVTMQLRQSLFWDTDIKTIDLNKHKRYVIERIIMRGRIEEVRAMFAFYGKNVVKESVIDSRYLDKLTLALCCAIFQLPQSDFRCYKLAQSNPQLWG